jgi:hypothetical protein
VALERLAENDVLGNPTAHFFKSGNIIRGEENDKLSELRELLPTIGPEHTRVEYDVWYDLGDKEKVHGYVYTDAMAKFIYLRVAGAYFSHKIMVEAAKEKITEEGERIFEDLGKNSVDKYRLRKARETFPFVVFLPGTNIINDAVNWDKLDNAVKQGAKLKCHPLSAAGLVANLKHKYGADNILDKKLSGHQLLAGASIVGCCENSEMGIVALAQGKTTYLFGKGAKHLTYSAIYNTVWAGGKPNKDMLKAILSSKYSGLVPVVSDTPADYINSFFNYYKDMPHVSPRNIST